jgi:hypothetical protein
MTNRVPTILGGIFFTLFASLFIWLGGHGLYRDIQFEKSDRRSTATIERLSYGGKRNYIADYHYMADGILQVSSSTIGTPTYYKLHVGQQVPIKFLSENPALSRIDWPMEGQWHRQNDETGMGFGTLFAMIGLFVACFGRPRKTIPFGEAAERVRSGWRNR